MLKSCYRKFVRVIRKFLHVGENMDQFMFSKDVWVEVQGEDVLQLESISDDFVSYQVVGFDNPCIVIMDYRLEGIAAIKRCMDNGKLSEFAEHFNDKSKIFIKRDPQKISIELHSSTSNDPRFRLWIASEFGRRIPMYRYRIFKSVPTQQGKYRLFSLYKRPYKKGKHQPLSSS